LKPLVDYKNYVHVMGGIRQQMNSLTGQKEGVVLMSTGQKEGSLFNLTYKS
jgi:cobalamin biosynthesis Co2+ chelatase CbiK